MSTQIFEADLLEGFCAGAEAFEEDQFLLAIERAARACAARVSKGAVVALAGASVAVILFDDLFAGALLNALAGLAACLRAEGS